MGGEIVYLRELQKTERERERKGGNDKRSDRSKRPMQELHSSSSFLSFSRVFFLPPLCLYISLSFFSLSLIFQDISSSAVQRGTSKEKNNSDEASASSFFHLKQDRHHNDAVGIRLQICLQVLPATRV